MAEETSLETTEVNIYDDLDDVDKAIVRMRVENPNISIIEMGQRLDMSRQAVATRLKKELVRKALSEAQKSAFNILLETQAEAARKMRNLLRNPDPEIQLKAAREILKGVLSENYNMSLNMTGKKRLIELMTSDDVDDLVQEGDDADSSGN